MSIITRYRPQSFDEVVGHKAQIASLKKTLKSNNSKAFLLTGPSGVGKTTLARIIANEWGAESLNIIEIDAATYTGIDDMKQIAESARFRGFGNPKKAIIVDEVHALSRQAIQSLLKAIEEPPEHLIWLFATTEASKIPQTIKTRCFVCNLKPVPSKELFDYLKVIDEFEGTETEVDILQLVADKSEGSPRQALEFLNLVGGIGSLDKARELLDTTSDMPQAIDLCRALMKNEKWENILEIMKHLEETPPETIRLIILNYFTKVIMSKNRKNLGRSLEILSAFSSPCNNYEKLAPIVLALGALYFGEE